ncbi:MAG TPA: hypothetical protein VFL16_18460 [Steroidobacteraceae bacterium]|nr:hypothetical protein [Steroidobacteraceae bacterium]
MKHAARQAFNRPCHDALRDYVMKAVKAGARDSRDAQGKWASGRPEPGMCPAPDFGPNGMAKQNQTHDVVRARIKATRPAA